jgi:hypothetical protein
VNDVIVRPPSLDNAHGVAALIAERDCVDFGEVEPIAFTGDELPEWWRLDVALLETDAWIALAGVDVVAYARARHERDLAYLEDDSCVHPSIPSSSRAGDGGASVSSCSSPDFAHSGDAVIKLIGLEVDSENEFGATRLYERAGMRVTRRYATYEKTLV